MAADAADDARIQALLATFQARMARVNTLKQFDRPVSAQELPRLDVRQGHIEVTPCAFNLTPAQRVKVIGSDATWIVGASAMGMGIGGNQTSLEYLDAKEVDDDKIWNAILTVRADTVYITVRGGAKSNVEYYTINERKGSFRVIVRNIRIAGAPLVGQMKVLNAESCEQFEQKSPDEYKQFVAPVIELFGFAGLLTPGPTDVYRVFTELRPTPDTERQLLEIVTTLASVDPVQRTAASQHLAKMGPPGVLAALRLDRSILTPEQSNRIDMFIRSHSCLLNEPQRQRHDPLFLADCLEFTDPRVRQLAMDELKIALNRDVDINLDADPKSLHGAVAELRKQIADSLSKAAVLPVITTQPAVKIPGVATE